MTWFAAMLVVMDVVSGSIQEIRTRHKKTEEGMIIEANAARMPAFRKDNYFLDINNWVTQDAREFPDSAGWRKMKAPSGGTRR